MIKLFEAYVTIDENGNLYGYGNGIFKCTGTNTNVEKTLDVTVYFLDGYVYLRNVGDTSDISSTKTETRYIKYSVAQQDIDEIKGAVEQVAESLPKLEEWYNDTLVPIFNDVDFSKYPENVKAFVVDAINDLFVRTVNEDKTVSYTINYDEIRHLVEVLFEESISSDIDAILGEGTFNDIKEFVTSDEFYAYDVDEILNYIQVEQGIDLEALFTALDDLAVILTYQEDATFETLLGFMAPLPEDFDVYDFITSEELAELTVMEAIMQAAGAPMEDDPETADVNERAEAEKTIKEMVLNIFDVFEKSTLAHIYATNDLKKEKENAIESIDYISNIFSIELSVNEDNSFNFFSVTIEQDGTTLDIKLADNIYFTFEMEEGANHGIVEGTIIIGGKAVEIDQDIVDEILAVFENDDKITIQVALPAFSGEAASNEFYYIIDGVLYRFEICDYYSPNTYDESNSYYNIQIKIEKYTGGFNSISAIEKCGGGYIYEVEMEYYETLYSTYSLVNIIAPNSSSYSDFAEIIGFQTLDLDELGVEFRKETDTNSFYFYFDEDGEIFVANSSNYNNGMHNYIADESLSTESNGECEFIYCTYYACSSCKSSYKQYSTNGHSVEVIYSYENGVYTARAVCQDCEKIKESTKATFKVETELDVEYYESSSYAGFTVTIDESTAGTYYLYSQSNIFSDTFVTVYMVDEETGELYPVLSNDAGENNGNFGTDIDLYAGTTYVFAPKMYSSHYLSGNHDITVFLVIND